MMTKERLTLDFRTMDAKILYLMLEIDRLNRILEDEEKNDTTWVLDYREERILRSNIKRCRMEINELKMKKKIIKNQYPELLGQ